MPALLLASLPLQLVCQLIVPESQVLNVTDIAANHQPQPEVEPATVHLSGISASRLATLPLQLVCKLLATNDSTITDDGTPVKTTSPYHKPLPEGYVKFSEDHAAYKIHHEYLTWNEARDSCIEEGGHLAIIDSKEKIIHVDSLKGMRRKWLHVGIYRSNATEEWVRVDNGHEVTYVPWDKDNPDRYGDCVGISVLDHGLVNYQCDGNGEYYVCEIPI